jgi:nitrite reductase/ring-hydroxylating ferredoxin subunit
MSRGTGGDANAAGPMSDNLTRFRASTYSPPYPDGWYRVAGSAEIKPGDVKHVECVGLQIAAFRGQSSEQIAVVDAFFPHQGANFTHGIDKGNRLRHPFHGWQLDGCGRVTPATEDRTFVHRNWEVIDYYGMVMIYHSTRLDTRAPYRPPSHPEIDEGTFVCRGEHDAGDAGMHIIEFSENSVGFSALHATSREYAHPLDEYRSTWRENPLSAFVVSRR